MVTRAGGAGDHPAAPDHRQPDRLQPDRLDRVDGLEQDHVRPPADREPGVVEAEDRRRRLGDGGKAGAHRVAAGHLRHVDGHVRNLQHVGAAQRIPRVHDAVVTKRHRYAGGQQFRHPGHAPALGGGVGRPWIVMLISGLAIAAIPASAIRGNSFET